MFARLAMVLAPLLAISPPLAAAELLGVVTHVRDGDTIEVEGLAVRLQGLHAPELGEPLGKESKAAMVGLALGKDTRCELTGEVNGDRVIGVCYVARKDLAAELVKLGLGRDCPRYSGGRYAELEQPGAASMALPTYCQPQ